MKKLFFIFVGLIFILFNSGCFREDLPPVTISFSSQVQTFIWASDSLNGTNTPDGIMIDYYIYNNTPHIIDQCEVYFIVYYEDSTYEITDPDITVGIRDHQINDIYIDTNKEMLYVDVYSVYITGVGECKYNIISH